jgi:hypothetical protein
MKKIILVTADDFGSSKTNPGQRPKHHFCCEDMGKKVNYHIRRDLGIFFKNTLMSNKE